MVKETKEEKAERKKRKKERKKEKKREKKRERKKEQKEAKRKKRKLEKSAAASTTTTAKASTSTTTVVEVDTGLPTSGVSIQDHDDETLVFERKKVELVVSLFPFALGDVLLHVKESIRSLLLKYSDRVGGVLLAFDHVALVKDSHGNQTRGVILDEMPHIHYRVEMDALVFCPTEGVKLKGTINECFPSHVGLLVHSYFNAMVSSDDLEAAGYEFDQDLYQWIAKGTALGSGDVITFTVQKLHECAGAISMEGSHPQLVPVD